MRISVHIAVNRAAIAGNQPKIDPTVTVTATPSMAVFACSSILSPYHARIIVAEPLVPQTHAVIVVGVIANVVTFKPLS